MAAADPALAIDVGGTKFAAGLVEPGGRVISWAQTATPQELDAEQLWRTLDALLTRVLTEAGVDPATGLAGVGCGCGGPRPRRSSSGGWRAPARSCGTPASTSTRW